MGDPKTITIPDAAGGGVVEASFKADVTPPTFSTWTITAGAGGTCNPSGVVQEQDGAPFDVVVTPDAGFSIDTILVNGVAV
jgi:hypothetical protein